MAGVLTATGGFLLAVLWMDLMFDVQARRGGPVPDESALASITAYYRRVTTSSKPMSLLIAAMMAALLAALLAEAVLGDSPGWLIGVSVVLAGGPIALAVLHTVPAAVRLGARTDNATDQSRLARAVLRDHVVCLIGMTVFVALWVLRSLN